MAAPQNTPLSQEPVTAMVQSVDELGETTGRLFDRIFVGLRRKREREAYAALAREADGLREEAAERALRIAQLTGVLAVISEGVIMQDDQGRIVLMNQSARELLGSVRHFWRSPLGQMFAEAREKQALDGEITLGSPQRVEVNQRVIGAQMAIVASPEGERLGTVLLLRDVTHDALAERLKNQFITQMSHELRSPLTAIKGMSDVLLAMPPDRPPNRRFLEAISRNVAVLDRMIVELLDISEIGAGAFAVRRQPIALAELVFDVIQGVQPHLSKAQLSLAVQVLNRDRLEITGDDRRLHWAINHLIDNAMKYTEPGGHIQVTVGRMRNGHVLLEVSDTGVGIAPEDLPNIFNQFYRGEARTAAGRVIDPRGLGQGLYVARAVAEAHGGFLSVASIQGEGSTFKLALPIVPPAEEVLPRPEMPAALPDAQAVDAVLPDSAVPPPPDTLLEPPVDPNSATVPNPRLRAEFEEDLASANHPGPDDEGWH